MTYLQDCIDNVWIIAYTVSMETTKKPLTPQRTYRLNVRIVELLREMAEEDAKNMTAFVEDLIRQEAKNRGKVIKKEPTV